MFLLDDGNHRFGLHISWLWKMGFAACGRRNAISVRLFEPFWV